jgi:hypothetical protein
MPLLPRLNTQSRRTLTHPSQATYRNIGLDAQWAGWGNGVDRPSDTWGFKSLGTEEETGR